MNLAEYQRLALKTDQTGESEDPELIPVLGLAGETGSILSEIKKARRDNTSSSVLRNTIRSELGDVLWYVAIIAHRFELCLDEIAKENLEKSRQLWLYPEQRPKSYDYGLPVWEQFPEKFEIKIRSVDSHRVELSCDGLVVGDPLTDNSHVEDGYRFHDVFHFAYAAVLGWSPVVRSIMGLKRKSSHVTDMVEDGGRASVIEEGIAAFVFSYAREHLFRDGERVEISVLKTIKTMVHGLEVSSRSEAEWREAIRQGFSVFRPMTENGGGTIHIDMARREITYSS